MANLGGKPPYYKTADELQQKIDEYFQSGHRIKTIKVGKAPHQEVVEVPAITITGLAIFLGFESRQSFYDYEKHDKYSYIIKRARFFIEREYEEMLQFGNTTGAIFALKNMGWKDNQQHDHSIKVDQITGFDVK